MSVKTEVGWFGFWSLLDFYCVNAFGWGISGPSPADQPALVSLALWVL